MQCFYKICVFVGFTNLSVKKYIKYNTKDVESRETQNKRKTDLI